MLFYKNKNQLYNDTNLPVGRKGTIIELYPESCRFLCKPDKLEIGDIVIQTVSLDLPAYSYPGIKTALFSFQLYNITKNYSGFPDWKWRLSDFAKQPFCLIKIIGD